MIRVFHILTDTNIGGAGRLLLLLLRHTDRTVFSVTALLPAGGAMIPPLQAEGIPVLPLTGSRDRSFSLRDTFELYRILRRERPDVVHTHASLSGRIAATLCGIPCRVYTRHCAFPDNGPLTRFPWRQLSGLLARWLSTDIIAVAEAAADDLVAMGIPRRRITVIPNGVDPLREVPEAELQALRRSLSLPTDAFVIGMAARMEPYKGHAEVLQAAETVLARCPEARFLLLGVGTEEPALRQTVAARHLEDRILFTGLITDVAPYFRLMDVHLNNSYGTETCSLAILEAKSIGIPSVATTFGGTPDMLRDGEEGILVPPHEPDALAAALLTLAGDPTLRRRMGQAALLAFEKRGRAELMTRRTEAVWRRRKHAHKPIAVQSERNRQ